MDLPHIRSAPLLRRSINVRTIFSSKDNSERWSRGLPRRLIFPTLSTASVESGLSAWRRQGPPSVNLSGHRREISGCRSRGRGNKHCGEYCHGTEEHGPQSVRETKRWRHRQRLIHYLSRMLRNNRPLRYLRPIFLIDILYKAINWEGTALTPRNDQLSAVPREIFHSNNAVLIGEAYSFQGKGVGCLDEPFIILIH
jgi:hypothetical protein